MSITIDEADALAGGIRQHSSPGEDDIARRMLPPSPSTTVGVIESIATGSPSGVFDQAESALQVAAMFSDPAQQARIPRVYRKTKIDTRRLAVDPLGPEMLQLSQDIGTIRDRMNLFYKHAVPLAVDVAGRALAGIACAAEDIGLLVFVTNTGFIAPGVDIAVVKQLGLSPAVSRIVVNFMGCAAAMNGIRTATDFVRANPDKKALVVCIELSSVNAVFADNVNDVIIHSLFGDGCAAVVIGAANAQQPLQTGKVVIRDTFSHLLDDAADGIVLGVNHNGITCDLSANLSKYIYAGVDPIVTDVLQRNGLQKSDVDLWAIHPGGPKIIEQSVRSLGIAPERAIVSWDVLAKYGNMLSVSLIFVLQQMVAQVAAPVDGKPTSTGVAFSFAPGVTLEGLVFDIVR